MAEPRKLSIPTMFCFGVGEAAGSFKNMAWGVLLLFYYQQIVGVEAALVGLAIAISVVMVIAILVCAAGTRKEIPNLRET